MSYQATDDLVTLGSLVTLLEQALKDSPAKEPFMEYGFSEPHSYRGYYEDLAFEVIGTGDSLDGVIGGQPTLAETLETARSAVGATYQGWKGGEYTMSKESVVWLVREEGETGILLTMTILEVMLGQEPSMRLWQPAPNFQ